MSILKCYAVWDSKAVAFSHPCFFATDGLASRGFVGAVAQEGHPFALHPADYSLVELGSFDDGTGQFTNLTAPRPVMTGLSAVGFASNGFAVTKPEVGDA